MSTYLVDTNLVIDVLKGQIWAADLLLELSPLGLSISIISYGEIYEGVYYDRDPQKAFDELTSLLSDFDVLPLTYPIMEQFGIVRGQVSRHLRKQIGDLDFLIASTALVHDMTVVTRNIRDFQPIPGVRLYEFDTVD